MHPGGVRTAMDLFDFEKSANLKHPNVYFTPMTSKTNSNFDQFCSVITKRDCLKNRFFQFISRVYSVYN